MPVKGQSVDQTRTNDLSQKAVAPACQATDFFENELSLADILRATSHSPDRLAPMNILALQRVAGNRTVTRLLERAVTPPPQQEASLAPPTNIEQSVGSWQQVMRDPQPETSSQGSTEGVEDYENQISRQATAEELITSVPDSDPVDGEFWIKPSRIRAGAIPIIDDEETSVIVGFRYSSNGYFEVYDLEGSIVEVGEKGLEAPLIDPIDILAGGIVGIGRGLVGGGGRAAARGIAGGVERAGTVAAARTGLVATIKALSRSAITAIRGVYRAIRFRGVLNFTGTVASHMADQARRVPIHILKLAIRYGTRSTDPRGVVGAFRYVIPMFRNGSEYTLVVVLREADNTILHFVYMR